MKKVSYYIAIFICVVALAGCASAQRGAMSRAHSGIEKGEYEFALKRLSQAEKYVDPTPDLKAEIVYLRATCYEGLERYSEAIGALKYLIDKFPDTSYAYQAKEKLRKLEKRN
jgi:tetratricopeptide (TPR) repeat protein